MIRNSVRIVGTLALSLFLSSCSKKGAAGVIGDFISNNSSLESSAPVVVTSPAASSFTSSDSSLVLSGTCQSGSSILLGGAETASSSCSGGSFSFNLSQNSDAVYQYTLTQQNNEGATTSTATFAWTRDSTLPPTPVISSPSTPYYSNSGTLNVVGSCVNGNTVELYVDSSTTPESTVCASSVFTITVTKSVDAVHAITVKQKNGLGSYSGSALLMWTLDTVNPATPVIQSPASSVINGLNSLAISGTCETGATVQLTNGATDSTTCASGAFSFTVNKSTDGSYTYDVNQTDRAGNISTTTSVTWTRDATAPSTPTITTPASSPIVNNASALTISGACENGATVSLGGGATGSMVCASSSYSMTAPQSTDGTYSITVIQSDAAGNVSASATQVWTRDTSAPSAVTITSPANSPFVSSDGTLAVAGTCETGATVTMSGDESGSSSCTAGQFSFSVSKSVDDTYDFSFIQTDDAGNGSGSVALEWTKSSLVPTTPVIQIPASATFHSNLGALTLSGSCDDGNTVELIQSSTVVNSVTCASSAFSFTVTKSVDGTYAYDVKQKNIGNIYSGAASVTWIRDTVAPATPVISTPASSPYSSNGGTLTISGSCETNTTVSLLGASTQSATCVSGAFSFSVVKSTDDSYDFSLKQTDLAGNISGIANLNWNRDTLAPPALTITNPISNPYTSSNNGITLSGACEPGATVALSGADTSSLNCPTSGAYSFSLSKTTNGTYNYVLIQTDTAANASTSVAFQWVRDDTIPLTPTITVPATNPHHSTSSSITISASCTVGSSTLVDLSGDVVASDVTSPAGSVSQTCSSSPVNFTLSKTTDGTYNFLITQQNTTTEMTSAPAVVQWVRDTVAPVAPSVISPSLSPVVAPGNLKVIGSCETGATVSLAGSATDSTTCSTAGSYLFTIVKSVDATYDFTLKQTDRAGNQSTTVSLQWVRDSNSVAPPAILSPAANPLYNGGSSITLSGTCTSDLTVTLSGSDSQTQTCSGGNFAFNVNKSVDGDYAFSLKQTYNSVDSSSVGFSWVRDTVAPTTTLTSQPSVTNISKTASFAFSANEANVSFECKLDSGSFASCSSPVEYTGLSNGNHSFEVRAKDRSNNVGASVTHSWSQVAYNTIALYHFSNGSLATDSGSYINTLTAFGTPAALVSCMLSTCLGTSHTAGFTINNNESLNAGSSTMTIEGFMYPTYKYINSGASNGYYMVIASKSAAMNGNTNLGWELRFFRPSTGNSKHAFRFVASLNGTTINSVSSTAFSYIENNWYYFKVIWNKGTVNFYYWKNGSASNSLTSLGSGTIGSVGSARINASTAPLRIGSSAISVAYGSLSASTPAQSFDGRFDEFRISQTARTTTTRPTAEFTAD